MANVFRISGKRSDSPLRRCERLDSMYLYFLQILELWVRMERVRFNLLTRWLLGIALVHFRLQHLVLLRVLPRLSVERDEDFAPSHERVQRWTNDKRRCGYSARVSLKQP